MGGFAVWLLREHRKRKFFFLSFCVCVRARVGGMCIWAQ